MSNRIDYSGRLVAILEPAAPIRRHSTTPGCISQLRCCEFLEFRIAEPKPSLRMGARTHGFVAPAAMAGPHDMKRPRAGFRSVEHPIPTSFQQFIAKFANNPTQKKHSRRNDRIEYSNQARCCRRFAGHDGATDNTPGWQWSQGWLAMIVGRDKWAGPRIHYCRAQRESVVTLARSSS